MVWRIFPLIQEHFLWPQVLKRRAFYYGWIRVLIFSKVPFGITKRFLLVRECKYKCCFLQCCITLGRAHEISLQDVKLSQIVIYRYKIIRIKCSFNWSCINYGRMHCDSVDSSLSINASLLTGARIPFLDNSFWISLTVFELFCYCHFVIRQDHGYGSPRTNWRHLFATKTRCFCFSIRLQDNIK